MSSSPNDSLINNNNQLRHARDKISKEREIGFTKIKSTRRNLNSMAKINKKKNVKIKNNKNNEQRYTLRYNNINIPLYERAKKIVDTIKREKSVDHLKKKSSIRTKIQNYFNEYGYYDTNFNHNYKYKNGKNINKNFNTLILMKKNREDLIMEEKRKYYFSPQRYELNKRNNFYKRLLNLRTVSGAKMNNLNNNEVFLYNFKENFNVNSYSNNNLNNNNDENNTNYTPIEKNTFIINNKKNKKYNNNNTARTGKNILNKKNKNENVLYFSQNNFNNLNRINIGFVPQKNENKTRICNPSNKESNIISIQSSLKQNLTSNGNNQNNNGEGDHQILGRIIVNKNEDNNANNTTTNAITVNNINTLSNLNFNDNLSVNNNNIYYKINVRRLDSINSMNNYNTNNSSNNNFNSYKFDEKKIINDNEGCLTEDNDLLSHNQIIQASNNNDHKNANNLIKVNNEDPLISNNAERSFNGNENVNNIRVCKNPEFQTKKKPKIKESKRKQSLKRRSGTQEPFRNNISQNLTKRERSKSKNKTPNKKSISSLSKFQNELLQNSNNNNNLIGSSNISTVNYIYSILPGNNGKLVEKVLRIRDNWEMIDTSKSQTPNLLWTPLSCQINFAEHSLSENVQYVNHFEFHSELTNKANTFINLFRYCEFNDIDLFSFYPLTILLSSNQEYLFTQIEGFKKCYQDLPNLINYPEEEDPTTKSNSNINSNSNNNLINKYYINYFNVKLSRKIGSLQKMKIPKTHYIGKNLWILKRTNLNRGRQMKVLSNIDEIVKEINLMFEEKKPNNLIIQKYIEAPLLYNGRKFDIRIWVLFTYVGKCDKYEVYVFKEGHLKACSDIFNIDSDNLFIHLTNYSVQKYNKNFSKVEIGNEISFQLFQEELNRQKSGKNFKKDIFPEIIKIISITSKAVKNKINIMNRKNCFEIFGYDFILDINYHPFLLEINTNPGLEESSPLIKMLVPRMINDALRLTIDKSFENQDGNDKKKNLSKFHVDGYNDEENMWLKLKTKKN